MDGWLAKLRCCCFVVLPSELNSTEAKSSLSSWILSRSTKPDSVAVAVAMAMAVAATTETCKEG